MVKIGIQTAVLRAFRFHRMHFASDSIRASIRLSEIALRATRPQFAKLKGSPNITNISYYYSYY
eukprot:SAG31_NODE_1386_length_8574_cov_2.055037_3_plen_64_part_00